MYDQGKGIMFGRTPSASWATDINPSGVLAHLGLPAGLNWIVLRCLNISFLSSPGLLLFSGNNRRTSSLHLVFFWIASSTTLCFDYPTSLFYTFFDPIVSTR